MNSIQRIFTNKEIDEVIDYTNVFKALETAFRGLISGSSVQPIETKTMLTNGRGDCIFYPALVEDLALVGVTTSPYITQRVQYGKSPVTSYTLLFSTETGEPVLLCNSEHLVSIRTAATTVLAARMLLPRTSLKLAIVGAGPLGLTHAKAAYASQIFSKITVVSPSLCTPSSTNYLNRIRAVNELGGNISVGNSIEDVVRSADVVMLCTSSALPVIELEWVKQALLITSISTNAPMAHEIDPSWLSKLEVYCDYRPSTPKIAGEMILAAQKYGWNEKDIIADIPDLLKGWNHSDTNTGRIKYFRSTGLGIEDIAVASELLKALK